ncbi:polysaccharide deacetylase family protein [Candidatus Pelagibacter sp.]|uniref:polysaccharide deacetylase family protein n=1 Tax=Candidatus Pelagibacter sp. TaxID=2024849 RepID=UPI003D096575
MIKTFGNNIYVVMYHYVRNIKKSKYPNLKGLEFSDFKEQILYFKKNFNVLSNFQFIKIINSKKIPKKKSVFLTFDDGYIDHYQYVFPFLKKQNISANFYPPVMCIKNKKVLDVNKIHLILEKEKNREKLLSLIFYYVKKFLNKNSEQIELNKINLSSRYDDKNTILIKRLLQSHLPLKIREKIVQKIFSDIVNIGEEEYSKELYMNTSNIQELYKNNFSIGSHGYNHFWWNKLNKNEQENEIKKSINYFKKINVYDKNFSVCFPYGSYDIKTLDLLRKYDIKFALTTKEGKINKKNIHNIFELPRYDTNDFK